MNNKKEFDTKFDSIIEKMKEFLRATNGATEEQLNDYNFLSTVVQNFILDKDQEFVIDHRDTLLVEAKKYYADENYDLSRLFYAIYVEHTFNNIIDLVCIRNKYDRNTAKSVLRSVSTEGKRTWLLTILGLPSVDKKYQTVLKSLTDQRNRFAHYKFHFKENVDKKAVTDEFKKIESAINYLKKYERLCLYGEE